MHCGSIILLSFFVVKGCTCAGMYIVYFVCTRNDNELNLKALSFVFVCHLRVATVFTHYKKYLNNTFTYRNKIDTGSERARVFISSSFFRLCHPNE